MKLDARTHGIHDLDDAAWVGSKYGTMYDAVVRKLRGDRTALRALFLGGGTYTAPRALLRRWPAATVHVAEIDPLVTRAAQARLGLASPTAGLTWEHEDGRTVVRAGPPRAADGTPTPYDLVFADAFGDVGVPWHLTTLEFVREVRSVLAPDGVYLANTIDVLETGRFVAAMRTTLRAAFRHVEVVSVGRETGWAWNFVFVASDAPLDLDGVVRTDPADPSGPKLPVYVWRKSELDALERRFAAEPLRDDFAPVERLLAPLVERAAPR
jgi:spermidine synthase